MSCYFPLKSALLFRRRRQHQHDLAWHAQTHPLPSCRRQCAPIKPSPQLFILGLLRGDCFASGYLTSANQQNQQHRPFSARQRTSTEPTIPVLRGAAAGAPHRCEYLKHSSITGGRSNGNRKRTSREPLLLALHTRPEAAAEDAAEAAGAAGAAGAAEADQAAG